MNRLSEKSRLKNPQKEESELTKSLLVIDQAYQTCKNAHSGSKAETDAYKIWDDLGIKAARKVSTIEDLRKILRIVSTGGDAWIFINKKIKKLEKNPLLFTKK